MGNNQATKLTTNPTKWFFSKQMFIFKIKTTLQYIENKSLNSNEAWLCFINNLKAMNVYFPYVKTSKRKVKKTLHKKYRE